MFRKNRRPALLVAMVAALTVSAAVPLPSVAATTLKTFQFTTTVDATAVGGDPNTPLRITYQFDPALAPGSGEFGSSPTDASYGPVAVILEVGAECAGMSGGSITVFNNAGTTIVDDSYDVRATTVGETLFGLKLEFFRFLLLDEQATMFSDTSLPTSPGFADAADSQQTSINLGDRGRTRITANDTEPFQLSEADLPGLVEPLIEQARALPVSSKLIEKLVAPLVRAATLLDGALTEKAVRQAQEALDEFRKLVRTNRNQLGAQAVDELLSNAGLLSNELPACGV